MRVIIVDDENKACTNLEKMINTYIESSLDIVGMANSTAEAEVLINTTKPDVVFLDIEMPEENAFQFLERIAPVNFEIVFVTAYDEFAVKAFRLNAIDYILKPIRINDLKNAISRINERLHYKTLISEKQPYDGLIEQVVSGFKHNSITLKDNDGVAIIDFKDIYYLEANGSYSKFVYFKDGAVKEIISSYPLSYYDDLLPQNMFFRIHRSFILNCDHIFCVDGDKSCLTITSGTTLPVSRRRAALLLDFLKEHHIS